MLRTPAPPAPKTKIVSGKTATTTTYTACDGSVATLSWRLKRNDQKGLHAVWRLKGCGPKTLVIRTKLSLYRKPRSIRGRIQLWLLSGSGGS